MTTKELKRADSAEKRKRAPRPGSLFALTQTESGALDAALRRFLDWRTGDFAIPALKPAKLTALHEGATAALRALAAVLDPPRAINREYARLRQLMQHRQGNRHQQSDYRDLLQQRLRIDLALVVDALAPFAARPGVLSNEDVYLWINCAADAWANAGGKVEARGRFAKALLSFKHKKIPIVGASQLRDAVKAWASRGG